MGFVLGWRFGVSVGARHRAPVKIDVSLGDDVFLETAEDFTAG
jgi:hypothetical protein